MTRMKPEFDYRCHICGTTFRVQTRFDAYHPKRGFWEEPSECPRCGAPLKSVPPEGHGWALSVILALYRARHMLKDYGSTPDAILEAISLTSEDVERQVAFLKGLDYAVWEANVRRGGDGDGRLHRGDREEIEIIGKAKADAASGKLAGELDRIAAAVKAKLAAQRDKHLAIFRERGGATRP